MSAPLCVAGQPHAVVYRARRGYTLVEVLVATALTLLLMAAVVQLFGSVTDTVSRGTAALELSSSMRQVQHLLQQDLRHITSPMVPPLRPEDGPGYTEIFDGPGPWIATGRGIQPWNTAEGRQDTSVGDMDDIIMFTATNYGQPYIGTFDTNGPAANTGNAALQSPTAEIAWFVRGSTLYRRVLLVHPRRSVPTQASFYRDFDVSVHQEGGRYDRVLGRQRRSNGNNDPYDASTRRLVANSLSDLTRREYRFAHQPYFFPHDARFWGVLGLPTLRETSHPNWPFPLVRNDRPDNADVVRVGNLPPDRAVDVLVRPSALASINVPNNRIDYWTAPFAITGLDPDTGNMTAYAGPRFSEDAVMYNVIGFDIKVWDPTAPVFSVPEDPTQYPVGNTNTVTLSPGDPAYRNQLLRWLQANRPNVIAPNSPNELRFQTLGAYVDLFYLRVPGLATAVVDNLSAFSGPGNARSQLRAGVNGTAIYDTWSTHYEMDGIDQDGDGLVDEGTDGLDNDNANGVDDLNEQETAPPYATPLRSIQIKIRVFERDTQQIREVTVVQDFVK
jgi:prepilin-type N-terminal cleavage/methylation domain-containing protein